MNNQAVNRFTQISFYILFTILVLITLKIAADFLLALFVGFIFSQILKPWQQKLIDKKIPPVLSAYLLMFFLIIIIVVPLFFFIQKLVTEAQKVFQLIELSDFSVRRIAYELETWPILNYFIQDPIALEIQLDLLFQYAINFSSQLLLQIVSNIPSFMIDLIFIFLSFTVFLVNGEKLKHFIRNLIPLHEYIKDGLFISSHEISKMTFLGSVMASSAQALTICLGFIILKIPNVLLATMATFILTFVPFVGSMPVIGLAIIYLILIGTPHKIVLIIIVGIFANGLDYLIRALFFKKTKDKLHPFIGLLSVIGGIKVFGFLGILVGPIFVALFLSMCKILPTFFEKKV